jgi:hypothetical protein
LRRNLSGSCFNFSIEKSAPLDKHVSQTTFPKHLSIIKLKFISNQNYLSFTKDSWTSPNVTAFMAVTVHFINDDFELKDLTLAVPHVQGKLWLGKKFVLINSV